MENHTQEGQEDTEQVQQEPSGCASVGRLTRPGGKPVWGKLKAQVLPAEGESVEKEQCIVVQHRP